jgi:hypothetical protein
VPYTPTRLLAHRFTRTRVDDSDYQVPFRFTGTLDKLNLPNAAEEKLLRQKAQETRNKAQ